MRQAAKILRSLRAQDLFLRKQDLRQFGHFEIIKRYIRSRGIFSARDKECNTTGGICSVIDRSHLLTVYIQSQLAIAAVSAHTI